MDKVTVEVRPVAYRGSCLYNLRDDGFTARPDCRKVALWVIESTHADYESVCCGEHTAELVGGMLAAAMLNRMGEEKPRFRFTV